MNSPLPRVHSDSDPVSLSVQKDPFAQTDGRPRRSLSLMRKYEAAALLSDLTISHSSHVAPATSLFEDTSCAFARGTLIDTVRGPVAIEDLLPGDYVETHATPEPVMWIGSTTFVPGKTDEGTTLNGLTRITADAFGMGRPGSDILTGPAARMVVRRDKLKQLIGQNTVLIPVTDYTDGDRIFDITPGGPVQLYHLMLRRHTLIRAGGIEMETYHPGRAMTQPLGHNIRALFLSMFPNLNDIHDFGELTWPRTRREVIDGLLLG